ncbi:MAG: YitT family protein [Solobacterium sp.]|nr:YitT family protein [Solobacterium sp.]
MNRISTNKQAADIISVIAGTFLLCVSVEMFILPYHILSGGLAGISVALYPFFHINQTLVINIMDILLLGLGTVFLGKYFFLTTALSALLYPVFNYILEGIIIAPEVDPLLASFYGGLLGGIGLGMVLRTGSSTGGMDIPPLIIHKYTGIKISLLVLATDALTVLLGYFAYGVTDVLIGLISVFSSSYAIGRVLSAGEGLVSKSVQIISDEWEKINESISAELSRGTTLLHGQGGYSGNEKIVLLCVVSSKQYPRLLEIINRHDPEAFVITTDATDMHGEGFTYPARI